jgi:hypothetical protein
LKFVDVLLNQLLYPCLSEVANQHNY